MPSHESPGVSDSSHDQQISPTCTWPTRFRQEHSTTSALLQVITDIAMGLNWRKLPDRMVCMAVDLSAAFDTVCQNKLPFKITTSPGHIAMAIQLSQRKTSQDLLQRCKVSVQLLHIRHANANRISQAGQLCWWPNRVGYRSKYSGYGG